MRYIGLILCSAKLSIAQRTVFDDTGETANGLRKILNSTVDKDHQFGKVPPSSQEYTIPVAVNLPKTLIENPSLKTQLNADDTNISVLTNSIQNSTIENSVQNSLLKNSIPTNVMQTHLELTNSIQTNNIQTNSVHIESNIHEKIDVLSTNLDHQFQIRSSLDSSLCLTRSEQQKLALDACELTRSSQWFKYSENTGLISNGNSKVSYCLTGNISSDDCDSLIPPSFSACNVQDANQSWKFYGNSIMNDRGGGEGGGECSIKIDQHGEFRRVYAIPDQFDRGVPQLMKHTLDSKVITDVLSHGCWCANLNGAAAGAGSQDYQNRYSQTMVPIDGLDTICRDWMNTRKCVLYKGGACFRQPRDGRYLLALDGKLGNIDNDFRCLDEQHIIPNSTSVDCLNDTCRIDKHYVDQIRDFFRGTSASTWQKMVIEPRNRREFCLPEKEDSSNNLSNNGVFGNTKKKYSRPRVRVCSGKAPYLVFESVEPPKPNKPKGGMVQIPGFPQVSKRL